MEEQAPFLLLYGYATVSGALGRLAACLAKPCYSARADENHTAANGPKRIGLSFMKDPGIGIRSMSTNMVFPDSSGGFPPEAEV